MDWTKATHLHKGIELAIQYEGQPKQEAQVIKPGAGRQQDMLPATLQFEMGANIVHSKHSMISDQSETERDQMISTISCLCVAIQRWAEM
ncbi:hypothetical protein J6590_064328 [Homalodisca vitripennis]|nr:hypothetical protein J6590_064328 [Homalodisca vitripennis]